MTTTINYVAQKGLASSPEVLILGQSMLPLANNLRAEEVREVMLHHGLTQIDPEAWYPQQLLLDIYNSIEREYGEFSEYLVAIGIKIIDTMELPIEVNGFDESLAFLQAVYPYIHRNQPADEGWIIERVNARQYRVQANMPYPDASTYGCLFAFARRFAPKGARFTVSSPIVEAGKPTRFDISFHA